MSDLFMHGPIEEAIAALRDDLINQDGSISTMRNYRFAIVPYDPKQEFRLRREIKTLSSELVASGWVVLDISLHRLLLDRINAQGDAFIDSVIAREKRLRSRDPERAQNHLANRIGPLIEGRHGIAADCAQMICDFADQHPDHADRIVALIGRAGALYPFFRSSALLRHLDGQTRNIPVVLLYPGTRRGPTGLSFMDRLPAETDYRPRIYP